LFIRIFDFVSLEHSESEFLNSSDTNDLSAAVAELLNPAVVEYMNHM